MYYPAIDSGSILLATSTDNLIWTDYPENPVIIAPDGTDFINVKYQALAFGGSNVGVNTSVAIMHYRIWYVNFTAVGLPDVPDLIYAESPDGVHWFNYIAVSQTGTLVVDPVRTIVMYGSTSVIYNSNATNTGVDWTFRIYYAQRYMINTTTPAYVISLAFSSNGYVWTGYNPDPNATIAGAIFMGLFDSTSFDSWNIVSFKVIKTLDFGWEAFYYGNNAYNAFIPPGGIGYATSIDGITWTRDQTLLTADQNVSWRMNNTIWLPSVYRANCGLYKLWFAVLNLEVFDVVTMNKVGYATLSRNCSDSSQTSQSSVQIESASSRSTRSSSLTIRGRAFTTGAIIAVSCAGACILLFAFLLFTMPLDVDDSRRHMHHNN